METKTSQTFRVHSLCVSIRLFAQPRNWPTIYQGMSHD